MVRALDLQKLPSIAESIEAARTLLLMGSEDIDQETFQQSMSIIVRAQDRHRPGGGAGGCALAGSLRKLTGSLVAWKSASMES